MIYASLSAKSKPKLFKMNVVLKSLLIVLCLALTQKALAQAPNITYATSSVAITPGNVVSIQATNTGGTVTNQYFNVSTFAGSNSGVAGTSGYVNGTGTAALFNNPLDMAFDASDNLYVCDAGNNAIRKITPAGVVTTFAGSPTGAAGLANGTGTAALFNFPDGLIFDTYGNLLVADYNNHAIREITPAGVVSTYYQADYSGFAPMGMCFDIYQNLLVAIKNVSSAGTQILYAPTNVTPNDIFYDGPLYGSFTDIKPGTSGNYYIADANRNEIEELTIPSQIQESTIAGNYNSSTFSLTGVGQNATLTQPTSVQPMADGTLYITDLKNNDVRKITPGDSISVLAGYVPLNGSGYPTQQPGYVDGAIANSQFNQPAYIRADSKGNLYVSEWGAGGNRIRRIALSGFFLTGPALPAGLVFDSKTGNITGNVLKKLTVAQTDTVTAINASGSSVTTITLTPGGSVQPPNISYAATNITAGVAVTITPQNTGGAVPATAYGTVTGFVGSPTEVVGYINLSDTLARFSYPQEMVMDAAGNLYVADAGNNAVREITPAGTVTTFAGSITGLPGFLNGTGLSANFNYPDGLAIDSAGNVYVSDYNNNAIRKITPGRVVTTFYSTNTTFGPGGMCFDKSGNLLVSAQDANQLWKITPSGAASVLSGSTAGYVNGNLASAKFNEPTDIKIDTSGNIYVADFKNNVIRKITTSGTVSLLAGDTSSKYSGYANGGGNTEGFANGKGSAAIFNNPSGIVVAPGGIIYAADLYNNDIRRITPDGTVGLVAGSATQGHGDANGIGTAAGLYQPVYIYMDDAGNGYIAEFAAERIRKIVLTGYSITGMLPAGLAFNPATGVISGTPTGPITKYTDTITAYNQGGYSTTIITLPASNIATLSNLVPNNGTLSPTFLSSTTSYADSVSITISSIILTPTTTDSTATVKINGTTVASGNASGDIPLLMGDNNITVVVTAQDGVTTDTYTVDVYRGAIPGSLVVNNLLTPNGDGKNDLWQIKDIQLYPQNTVNIFDQSGKVVYTKQGYNNDWGGTFNGSTLPQGTYYYVVDLGPNLRKYKGFISILKN